MGVQVRVARVLTGESTKDLMVLGSNSQPVCVPYVARKSSTPQHTRPARSFFATKHRRRRDAKDRR